MRFWEWEMGNGLVGLGWYGWLWEKGDGVGKGVTGRGERIGNGMGRIYSTHLSTLLPIPFSRYRLSVP